MFDIFAIVYITVITRRNQAILILKKENIMTKSTKNTFAQVSPQKVNAVVKQINDQFELRGQFVSGLNVDSGTTDSASRDYQTIAKKLKLSVSNFARVLASANIKPSVIFNKHRSKTQRANMKAIIKAIEASDFLCGDNNSLQAVTRCFLGASILMTVNRDGSPISNEEQKKILSSVRFSPSQVSQELIDLISEYKHISMTSAADTQSSQMRTILNNLGACEYVKDENDNNAIQINLDHVIIKEIANRFEIALPASN